MMKVWLILTFLGNHGLEAHKQTYQIPAGECYAGVTAQDYARKVLADNPTWTWDQSWACKAGGLEQDS